MGLGTLAGGKKKVFCSMRLNTHIHVYRKKIFLIFLKALLALWRTVLSNSLRSDGLIVFSSAEDRGALMRVFNNPSVVQ